MDRRWLQRTGRPALECLWSTVLSFLVLAFPANAALGSDQDALVIQITAAAFLGALFGLRRILKPTVAGLVACFSRCRSQRSSLRSVRVDAVEQAGS